MPIPALGILMLDTRFPRLKGDIGNAGSFSFPVRYKIVRGASPQDAVPGGAEGLLAPFIDAGRALVGEGVAGLSTSCGFLSLFQNELSEALGVPVLTSSLMQVAQVNATLPPGKRAGVLSIQASSLTPAHLAAAGVPEDTPLGTTEGGHFTEMILSNAAQFDVDQARAENVAAAKALAAQGDVGAIVLECTNMGVYAADIAAETGLPVYSIITALEWFHRGLTP